jgi:hypothetical protein
MTNQLERLQTLVQDATFTAPLSPAISLDIITGYDRDGWAEYLTTTVGMRVVTPSGRLYVVIGFTVANTIIVIEASGLDADPAIASLELTGKGMKWADAPTYHTCHTNGLVAMLG